MYFFRTPEITHHLGLAVLQMYFFLSEFPSNNCYASSHFEMCHFKSVLVDIWQLQLLVHILEDILVIFFNQFVHVVEIGYHIGDYRKGMYWYMIYRALKL